MSEPLRVSSQEKIYRTLLQQVEAVISGTDDLVANLANVTAILKPAFKKWDIRSKSEIVVPLVHHGQTELVLDIDSDELNAFDPIDQHYLELIIATIAKQNFRNPEDQLR